MLMKRGGKLPEFIIDEEVKCQNIEDVFNPEIAHYLKAHGFKTVRDVIRNQKTIPNKYLTPIKAKLIFGLDVKVK